MQPLPKTFVDNCSTGNRAAQKAFFEGLFAPMFRVCLRYTGHHQDAEDCTMKGFMKAFHSLPKFRYEGEGSVERWLRRIMVNECLMELRKKKSLMLHTEEAAEQAALPAEALLRIDAEALNSLVMQLPAGYRAVFNLFAVDGYSHAEIAQLLGISENTSKSQFSKAKDRLKMALQSAQTIEYGRLGK